MLIPSVSLADAEPASIELRVIVPSPEKYPFNTPIMKSSDATNASDGTNLLCAP